MGFIKNEIKVRKAIREQDKMIREEAKKAAQEELIASAIENTKSEEEYDAELYEIMGMIDDADKTGDEYNRDRLFRYYQMLENEKKAALQEARSLKVDQMIDNAAGNTDELRAARAAQAEVAIARNGKKSRIVNGRNEAKIEEGDQARNDRYMLNTSKHQKMNAPLSQADREAMNNLLANYRLRKENDGV